MSGAWKKSLPSWRKAADANGFGILCIRGPEGERFVIGPTDPTKVTALCEKGFRVGVWVPENELRAQLAQAGFSEPDIEASIQLSRDWATTVTREPSSKPILRF
jgi:hypothetical protein